MKEFNTLFTISFSFMEKTFERTISVAKIHKPTDDEHSDMSYEEEKKYLVEKAKEFLGDAEVVWLEDVKGNTEYLTLNYFGKPLEVEVVGIETFGDDISVRTYSEEYPDGADSSSLAEFSNDEIKRILELFDIDY